MSANLSPPMWHEPARVVEDAEAKTCAGCTWIARVHTWLIIERRPDVVEFCGNRGSFGTRCEEYRENPF